MHRPARLFKTTLAVGFVAAALSCRARVSSEAVEVAGDPPPPVAPVVAVLSEDGRLAPDARTGSAAPNPIRVVEVGPEGKENGGRQIFLRFNQPMSSENSLTVSTSPPTVPGKGRFIDAFRYVYSINGALPEANSFEVDVRGAVTSKSGKKLEVAEAWSFETVRPTASLSLNDYYGDETEEGKPPVLEWDESIDIDLSSPIDRAALRKAITVTMQKEPGAEKVAARFKLVDVGSIGGGNKGRIWRIRPRAHWPAGALIEADLSDGLVTKAGPLPTLDGQRVSFRVSPGITAKLECNDQFEGGCGPSSFSINFNYGIPEKLLEKIRISPKPVDFDLNVYDSGEGGRYSSVSIWGDLKVGTRYKVRLPKNLRGYDGQAIAGPQVITVPIVPPSPSMELTSSGTFMARHRGSFGLETRYYRGVDLEIDPLTDAELAEVLLQSEPTWFRKPTNNTSKRIRLSPSGPFAWDSRAFEVTKLLGKPSGAALVRVTPRKLMKRAPGKNRATPSTGVFQLTNLSVVGGDSPAGSFIWINELERAIPVPGATAAVWTRTPSGLQAGETYGPSDKNGLIELKAGERLPDNGVLIISAAGGDRVGLPLTEDNRDGYRSWRWSSEEEQQDHPIGNLMTDRPLYRPGERVRVLGWVANATVRSESRLAPLSPQPISVTIEDPNGLEVARRTVRNKDFGKYWATLELPADVALGRFRVTATIGDKEFQTRFKVREFQTPSFDVTAHTSTGDVEHGGTVAISAQANYLHGMPVPLAESRQVTRCSSGNYRPPGSDKAALALPDHASSVTNLGKNSIPRGADADEGRVRFVLDTGHLPAAVSHVCNTSVAIQDAAHEEMGADASFNTHPSRYILTRELPSYEKSGVPFEFTVEAVDYEGKHVSSGKITAGIYTTDADGRVGARLEKCTGVSTETRVLTCRYTPKKKGRYFIRVRTKVDGTRVETSRYFQVWQPRKRIKKSGSDEPKFTFQVVADPTMAEIGDTVELSMESPRADGRALLVRSQGGIRSVETIDFVDHHARRSVRAAEAWTPRQYFTLLEPTPRTRSHLPRLETRRTEFGVRETARKLEVSLDAPESVGPSQRVRVDVVVRDASGRGVQGHVSVWAVDEAILALEPWVFPDLVSTFSVNYGRLATFIEDFSSIRWEYKPREDPLLYSGGGGYGSGFGSGHGSGAGGALGRVARTSTPVRRRLEATPIFVGDVETDAKGKATVRGRMPDNLTTFRLAAVASAPLPDETAIARFGVGEGRIRVTSDLSVRPIVPGVLRPGDRSELSAMVNNMTSKSGSISIKFEMIDAAGVLASVSETEVEQKMSGAQVLVPFAVEALGVGEALVRATVAFTPDDGSAILRDAMEIPLQVTPERTLVRHAAVYGSLADESAIAVDVDRPLDLAKGSGKVQVSTYTSLLGGYQDNVDDLVQYPYGCVEQTSTRLIPLLALGDLAETYPLGIRDVDAYVAAAVTRLSAMQTSSGGFGYWPGASRAHFYGTAYATWVLTMADKAGHPVPERVLSAARDYLSRAIEEWAKDERATARDDARIAMALHAVASGPGASEAAMARMVDRFDRLPIFARTLLVLAAAEGDRDGELASTLIEKLRDDIDERSEYARTKASKVRYGWFFDSPARSDSMMLLAFATVRPTDPLTGKLARGIARARDAGQLRNTQENAYALVAMATYARVAEAEEPDMFVQGWLDQSRIMNAKFRGRTFDLQDAFAPLVRTGADPRFTLSKRGAGRLYYRIGMEWSPATMPTEPVAAGFAIEKRLLGKKGPVRLNGSVEAGSVVRLEVTVTNDIARDYVAAEIPIPAGLTPVDTSIGKGRAAMAGASGGWSNHRELRPDRVVLFSDHLNAGEHHETIYLRATTPGRYRVPPAKVESMYYPEIHGFTPGDTLTVTR